MSGEKPAYSEVTGETYATFEALVKAEANGWTVAAVLTRGSSTWPWLVGLYENKPDAMRAAARMRRKFKRDQWKYPTTQYSVHVRPVWKDERS